MLSSPGVPMIEAGRPKHLVGAAAEVGLGQPATTRMRAGNSANRAEIVMPGEGIVGRGGTRVTVAPQWDTTNGLL
jgi:hypothetical protein